MGNNPTYITITSGTIVKTIFFLVAFYLLFLLRDLVLVVLTSVVLAAAVEPAARWFIKYRIPRIPAVLIVYLIVLAALAGLISLFLPPLLSETNNFLSALPQYMSQITAWDPFASTGGSGSSVGIQTQAMQDSGLSAFSLRDVISDLQKAASGLQGGVVSIISSIFGGLFSFILIVVLSFYLAVQENGIDEFLRLVTPIKHRDYVADLWRRSQEKIGYWMQGQLLLIILIGVLTYLGLAILGVPYALLLALLAGLMELIPIFGPIIAAIPAVILALANGISFLEPGVAAAGAVGLFYVLIQQFENHLIYPLVVQKVVGVPPMLVIIGLIVGWNLAGFLGVILAVPVAAGLMEFAHDIQKKDKNPSPEQPASA